jgi:glycosyltransferase involved in cell wall biosynthesis
MNRTRLEGLVSVVIPVYKAERFLAEAVNSVLAQTYTRWELLLVDDGSTDGSPTIARRYADSDSARMRYLEHPGHHNAGVCTSRNLGVRHSHGEYVAILDADDIWLPDKLQQQVELMEAYPEAGLIYGHSIYFNDDGGLSTERVPSLAPPGKLYRPPELLKLTYPLGTAGAPCPSGFLMRYEALEEIGGFEESFDPDCQPYEDQAFLAKVYLNSPVFVAGTCWDKYRCHESSCWGRAQRNGTDYRLRRVYLEWLQRYLQHKDIRDAEIWTAVQRLTWPYRHPMLARAKRIARGAARRVFRRTV